MTIKRLALALPLMALVWIATLAIVMRVGGAAPAAFVPFPTQTLLASLPSDVTITSSSSISLTLRSDAANLPARLYASGAWLVLPAGLEACIPSALRS